MLKKCLLFLLVCVSCGDYSRDRPYVFPPEAQEGSAFPYNDFSTRLRNDLLISGDLCVGGEVVDGAGQTYTCNEGQWLVTVDNVNTCTPQGCTDIYVPPLIASLRASSGDTGTTFYDLIPINPVGTETSNILNSVLLRSRPPEEPRVMFR